jgi:GTP-binding protein
MSLMATARFFNTVVQLGKLPPETVPEVAFVGRSNAGKSSVINALCNHRGLAHSSRTPGRTQALNYFEIGRHHEVAGYLVDTPGYGFAAVGLQEKKKWDGLAGGYLQMRENLAGVVLVTDSRRGLTDLDLQLIDWVNLKVPLLVLLNKCDKLTRQEQIASLRDIKARFGGDLRSADSLLFSSLKKTGITDTQKWVSNKIVVPVETHENNEQ